MVATAGYSGRSLPDKLGLRDGQAALFVALPGPLAALADAVGFASVERAEWETLPEGGRPRDVIHAFTASLATLRHGLPALRRLICDRGMIWISWPKRASGVPSDLSENDVRAAAIANRLVDVKVCAVDAVWSGLKLVIPRDLRAAGRGPA